MTDEDFYEELRQIVERRATSTHLVDTIAFAEEVAERLEDDPAFGEYVPAEFSGANKRNKQFRIHGFTRLDESDGSIGLVVAKWDDAEIPETLTSSNVAQLSGFLEAFAQESIKEDLCDRMTESNGAYELALLLKNAIGKINRIRLHIFSNQPLSQRFKEQICEPIRDIVVERHVWDLQRLRAIYESSREREVVELDMNEFGSKGIEYMEAARTSELQSYLCILSGDTLANMFERYGSRLLEGNVRSFLGMKGGVNKGIRKTVQDSPELFFAYNNGIAATASAIGKKIVDGRNVITNLVDLQIVNGGQTTASILNARKKDRLSLAGVSVAMKLTVIEGIEANALIPKIAEFANTQNKIAVADFFANHPFHRKMEEISRRLVAPAGSSSRVRSKWFYERSRGQYQNERLYLSEAKKNSFDLEYPAAQVVNKTDLAKFDGVFEERPHWVSLGSQKNFVRFASTFESKNPDVSSVEHWTTISPKYGDAYYQRIAAIAILWKGAEGIVSGGRGDWYKGDFRAQIVAYALSLLLHSIRKAGFDLNTLNIWNLQSVPSDLSVYIKKSAELAQIAILSPPSGMTNIGEWTKKDACWEKAKLAGLAMPTDASWMVSREDARLSSADARKQGAQDDAIALQRQLLQMVQEGYWASLLRWPGLSAAISESQRSLVIKASTMQGFMRIATEKDWRRLQEVRDLCDEAGFRRD